MRAIVHTALTTLLDCGVSVIPIRPDGSKAALVPWHPYQHRRASQDEVREWTQRFAHMDCGLAVVAGEASGQVEVLDFDAVALVEPWRQIVDQVQPGLVETLVAVHTPRPGMTFWYRCPTIAGNQKLAQDASKVTLIETRGQGGYAIIPPSPGACHPTHRPYTIAQGTLRAIPEIATDARTILWNAARMFHTGCQPPEHKGHTVHRSVQGDRDGPWDIFNASVCWHQVLEPHGWTYVNHTGQMNRWRRPGKIHGVSATSGLTHIDLLYVFSQNAAPLESQQLYSKFTAYTFLNHGGDYSAAAKQLWLEGYRSTRRTGKAGGRPC